VSPVSICRVRFVAAVNLNDPATSVIKGDANSDYGCGWVDLILQDSLENASRNTAAG
jgi:hypothetical protein